MAIIQNKEDETDEPKRTIDDFPYGECVIIKSKKKTPLSKTLEKNKAAILEAKMREDPKNLVDRIIKEILKTATTSLDSEEMEILHQNLKIYYESCINPAKNADLIFKVCENPEDPYSEEMSEVKYLFSSPVSFIILGKPTPENYKLARKISANWGCVCIDPITALEEELKDTDSPTYGWCQKLLNAGKYVPSEVVMRIMARRALTDEVLHKGFVLCGLPFPPLEDEPSILEQLHMVFSWPIKPKVLIYVTYPDSDALLKTQQMLYDINTGHYIHKNVYVPENQEQGAFNINRRIKSGSITDLLLRDIEHEKQMIAPNDVKHLVVVPQPNLKCDLLRYRQVALPALERYVVQIDPQYVIRVDGRTSPSHMLTIVRARADALSLQRVIKPVPMMVKFDTEDDMEKKFDTEVRGEDDDEEEGGEEMKRRKKYEEEGEGEEEKEYVLKFNDNEEAYQYFAIKDSIGEKFKWCLSDWGYMCPVELFSGKIVEGHYEFAARFLDKVYFLSSMDALLAFMKNPRMYLAPPNPKPPCKFVVIGHVYAGKSEVSLYLSHVYKGKVISYAGIESKQKEALQGEEIRTKITNEVLKRVNREKHKLYAEEERQRKRMIEYWLAEQQREIEALNLPDFDEFEEVEEDMFISTEDSPPFDLTLPLVPQLSNARCRWMMKYPEDLLAYLPPELSSPTPLPRASDPMEPDIAALIEIEVKKLLEEDEAKSPFDKLCEILVEEILKAEEENKQKSDGTKLEGGWVIDGMPPDPHLWQCMIEKGIVPELVISLEDLSPGHRFLIQRWISFQPVEPEPTGYPGPSRYIPHPESDVWNELIDLGAPPRYVEAYGEYESKNFPAHPIASEGINAYLQSLKKFDSAWLEFQATTPFGRPPLIIDISYKKMDEIKRLVTQGIEAFYCAKPVSLSSVRKGMNPEEEAEDEEREGEEEETVVDRKLGDTYIYCPVAYKLHNVLWKGKNELTASYKCKIYSLSSETALEKFLEKPWEYAPFRQAEKYSQPLRICIIGPVGSGKTSVGRLLARSLGLFFRDYETDINYILIPKDRPVGRRTAYIPKKIRSKEEDEIDELCGEEPGNLESREVINHYLLEGAPVPESLVEHVLNPLWHTEPYKSSGFVFSDFPLHPEDFDILKEHTLVPDMIISLKVQSQERIKNRLLGELKAYKDKEEMKKKRKAEKEKMAREAVENIIRRSMYNEFGGEDYEDVMETKAAPPQTPDVVEDASGSEYDATDATSEVTDNIKEQYEEQIEEWFDADIEKLETIKTLAEEEKIPWIEIIAENEAQDVCLQIIHQIQDIINRTDISSPFEQVIEVTIEEAENLLESGYCFLSRFGRWCPVQLEQDKNPLQLYIPMKKRAEVHPIVYRHYIYFLGGQKNKELFMKNPLYYINQAKPIPLVPVKMAIVGPPKCGKTTIANRIAKHTNTKVITIGQACRYVLDELRWTELAQKVEARLREGEVVPIDLAIRCVEAATMDPRCAAHGYIFDGFPVTTDELYELTSLNLIPYVVICVDCSVTTCHKRLLTKETLHNQIPLYPLKLLRHKYRHWLPASYKAIKVLKTEYSNVVELEGTHTLWWLFENIMHHVYKTMKCIVDYYNNIKSGKPGKLFCMCISHDEFTERQSMFSNFCPGCLRYGILNDGGEPVSKTGLVHYKHFYYWLCTQHIDGFLRRPECFLPPINKSRLPEHIPYISRDADIDLEISHDGFCIVCYCEGMPERIYVRGIAEYAAVYKGKRHMFCAPKHRDKFMATPTYYSIQDMCTLPLKLGDISIMKLPTLGFLEQTVANQIYAALLAVATERPKYLGLPLSVSGAIYMGYYLKLRNVKKPSEHSELLKYAQELFIHRCRILKKLCHRTNIRNPLLSHPAGGEPRMYY